MNNIHVKTMIENMITFDLDMKRKHPASSRPCMVAWLSLNLMPSRYKTLWLYARIRAFRARILNICRVVTNVHLPCLIIWHTASTKTGALNFIYIVHRYCKNNYDNKLFLRAKKFNKFWYFVFTSKISIYSNHNFFFKHKMEKAKMQKLI